MPDKRQIHVIPPWQTPDQSDSAVLLMELPVDEPYAFAISHTSTREVKVCIHSGKRSEDAEKWCKTSLFNLTDDGEVESVFYEGEKEIEATVNNDWQEWSYQRLVKAKPALDPFALEFQRAYLDSDTPINQPLIDPEDAEYLNNTLVTISAKQVVDRTSALSIKAFALDDSAIDTIKANIKNTGQVSINVTMKAPVNVEDRETGDRIEAFGLGLGWNETRYNGSKTRILGFSAFAEDV